MSYETVDVRIEDGVAEVTLNRPERLNAWNEQFGDELRQAILEDCADPVRAGRSDHRRRAWILLGSRPQGDAGAGRLG